MVDVAATLRLARTRLCADERFSSVQKNRPVVEQINNAIIPIEGNHTDEASITDAAARIMDVFMGGDTSWRERIDRSLMLESADWARAIELANAALSRATPAPAGWQPIESAPYNTVVEIKVGHMTLQARLEGDASEDEDGNPCNQWLAEHEGEHPPCWSDGACWSSNENEDCSIWPTAWRYIPSAPAEGGV